MVRGIRDVLGGRGGFEILTAPSEGIASEWTTGGESPAEKARSRRDDDTGRGPNAPIRKLAALAAAILVAFAALTGAVGFIGTASAANAVAGCTTINEPGVYELTSNINDSGGPCIEITTSDVLFDGQGHHINSSSGSGSGVRVTNNSASLTNVTVRNVRVTHGTRGVIFIDASDGAVTNVTAIENEEGIGLFDGSNGNEVTDNNVSENTNDGIVVDAADANRVENNTAKRNLLFGIRVTDGLNNEVIDNHFESNNQSGVAVVGGSNGTVVDDNTVIGNNRDGVIPSTAAGIFVENSENVRLERNVVRNNRRAGVSISNADGIEVRDNRITENCGGQFGVRLANTADALFVGNNVSNNTGVGMQVFATSPNLTVRDSKFNDNGGFAGFQDEPGTTLVNVTANGNADVGISLSVDSVARNVTARNNTNEGLTLNGNVTIDGGTFADNGGVELDAEPGNFTATDLTIAGTTFGSVEANKVRLTELAPPLPALPGNQTFFGRNVSVVAATADSYFDVEVRYTDAEAQLFNESSLAFWQDTGTWVDLGGSVDTAANTASANVTTSGNVALLGLPNEPPNAALDVSTTSLEAGDTVSLDATDSTDPDGSIVRYEWEFGDGTTDTGPTASHTYGSAGTYTVELRIVDSGGSTDNATVQLSVQSTGGGGSGGPSGGSSNYAGSVGDSDDDSTDTQTQTATATPTLTATPTPTATATETDTETAMPTDPTAGSPTETTAESPTETTSDGQPGFGVIAALIALVAAALLARRR